MKVLVIGGAASGKSEVAERLACTRPGRRTYVATLEALDAESLERVDRHRYQRENRAFRTLELPDRLEERLGVIEAASGGVALLECVGTLLSNEMFSASGINRGVDEAVRSVLDDIRSLERRFDDLVVVTNDVARGCDRLDEGTAAYVEALGWVNAQLACKFDAVVEVVFGIEVWLKGGMARAENGR